MKSENDLGAESIIVMLFCLLTSFGAGYSLKGIVSGISGWQALAFAAGAGIFVAISAILLYQFLVSLREE